MNLASWAGVLGLIFSAVYLLARYTHRELGASENDRKFMFCLYHGHNYRFPAGRGEFGPYINYCLHCGHDEYERVPPITSAQVRMEYDNFNHEVFETEQQSYPTVPPESTPSSGTGRGNVAGLHARRIIKRRTGRVRPLYQEGEAGPDTPPEAP